MSVPSTGSVRSWSDGHAALAPPGGGTEGPRPPKIVPVRHPGRWVAVAIALVLVAQLVHALVTNPGLEWATFRRYFFDPSVLHGVWVTIELTVYAALAGFAGGMVLAFMRLSPNPLLRVTAYGYVWVVRSVPLLVQVLFWFNISYLYSRLSVGVPFGPEFFSFSTTHLVSSVSAAVIALSVNEAAFASEIVRAGVLSVSHGQLEAAAALGIPRRRQLMRIVLPQAMRTIAPNAANQLISLFKNTSIVSVMAIMELFYTVQVIYGRTSRIVPMLLVATAWYVLLTTLLTIFQYYVERRFAKGTTRALPPTPVERVRLAIRNLRAAATDEGTPR
ncbi:amino acid ABC transporter permease [Streptomyces asiaticus]